MLAGPRSDGTAVRSSSSIKGLVLLKLMIEVASGKGQDISPEIVIIRAHAQADSRVGYGAGVATVHRPSRNSPNISPAPTHHQQSFSHAAS